MDRRTAIEWLEQIKHRIRGGDEEFDRQRKESIDMAITDMKICEANNAGWISVKERLPKTNEDYYSRKTYIVSTVRGNVLAMEYVSKTIRGKAVKRWEWKGRISPWKVTHWMPLPEPPKEEI